MANKRANGEGTVRKRTDGRWEGFIVIGHKNDGKPMYKSVFAKTQKELVIKLRKLIDDYKGVDLTEDSMMTVKEWLDKWMKEYVEVELRPGTIAGYRIICEYIKEYIGDIKLNALTAADCQLLYNRLLKSGRKTKTELYGKGLSVTTVNKVHVTLHRALKIAQNNRLVATNVTENTQPPKPNHKEMTVLDEDQMEIYYNAIEKDPIWKDFFYVELTTGLRLGEICALQWSDFDVEKGKLKIQRTLSGISDGKVKYGAPKTDNGYREFQLPVSTYQLLIQRMESKNSIWIFPNPLDSSIPVSKDMAYRRHKKILKTEKLPLIRFHDLRHTFATHAMRIGVDPKTLSGLLGHSNASFTLDTYTHVTNGMQFNAADRVGNLMESILGKDLKPWETEEKMEPEL